MAGWVDFLLCKNEELSSGSPYSCEKLGMVWVSVTPALQEFLYHEMNKHNLCWKWPAFLGVLRDTMALLWGCFALFHYPSHKVRGPAIPLSRNLERYIETNMLESTVGGGEQPSLQNHLLGEFKQYMTECLQHSPIQPNHQSPSQAMWLTVVIPVLRTLKQEDHHEFWSSLDYRPSSRTA